MSEKLSIAVEDARFYAYHGVFAQETIVGNEFEVSVKVDLLLPKSIKDDNDKKLTASLFMVLLTISLGYKLLEDWD